LIPDPANGEILEADSVVALRERALATALFDSGSSIGGAIAPFIVLWIYFR